VIQCFHVKIYYNTQNPSTVITVFDIAAIRKQSSLLRVELNLKTEPYLIIIIIMKIICINNMKYLCCSIALPILASLDTLSRFL
jgi:hypothetical protein